MRFVIIIVVFFLVLTQLYGQVNVNSNVEVDYKDPDEYEIGGITISGVKYLDQDVLVNLSGLSVGDVIFIPGEETADAIRKLWKQGLFSDVEITLTKVIDNKAFIDIYLQERPRLSRYSFSGIKKSEAEDIREMIKLTRGNQVTDNILNNTKNIIKGFFVDKGYYNVEVDIVARDDSLLVNNVILDINVEKNERIKIDEIIIVGNTILSDNKLRRAMKETKQKSWYNIFKSSKFIDNNYDDDKLKLIDKYNENGFRDAIILEDSIYFDNETVRRKVRKGLSYPVRKLYCNIFKKSDFEKNYIERRAQKKLEAYKNKKKYTDVKNEEGFIVLTLKEGEKDKKKDGISIRIDVEEGPKYYFRNITWVGNTKYKTELLSGITGIKKGDVYNQKMLDENLNMNPNGAFSLYQDNGYLFSSIIPVEVKVENDSIDIEMRVYEGKQAVIGAVTIIGNTKTNEHVIRREIRSKPGELYSRSDIQRSIRELAQLGYFDPEKLNLNPTPHPAEGTVDLEYVVEEKPSDQIELSGGWGAQMIVGTLGVTFNNFSAKNFFNKNAWRPLPSGDGQRLSVRAQSNGRYYQSYNMSFVEPWLGGKRPNSLTVSLYHTILTNGSDKWVKNDPDSVDKYLNPSYQSMKITGVAVGFGTRLKKPDDYFTIYHELSYQNYNLNKYQYRALFSFSDGVSNNISYKVVFGRNSVDAPIYPRRGSMFSISGQLTLPYSTFREDHFWELSDDEKIDLDADEIEQEEDRRKYEYIEYHKWKFNASWFSKLAGNLVLNTKAEFGFLGYYDKNLRSPFEGFNLGGDGLVTYNLYGMETIALRGYENGSLTPDAGGNIYDKFTMELRYPISLNPNATLYALAFVEGGSAWYDFKDFNLFDIHRSAGVGVRIFLPMFGKLGVDWGYGFDPVFGSESAGKSQFHFIIGQNF